MVHRTSSNSLFLVKMTNAALARVVLCQAGGSDGSGRLGCGFATTS